MKDFLQIDWDRLLIPDIPILETLLRGSLVYLVIFLSLRFIFKRQAGAVGITDLLVVVLIADAAQNAMASDYHSITDGLLLVGVIAFWSYFLDWLGYYFPHVEIFVHPPPLPLVKNGQMLRHNMRKELITEGELMTQLREQGVNNLSEVKIAYMEGDGYISVITHNNQKRDRNSRRSDRAG